MLFLFVFVYNIPSFRFICGNWVICFVQKKKKKLRAPSSNHFVHFKNNLKKINILKIFILYRIEKSKCVCVHLKMFYCFLRHFLVGKKYGSSAQR